MFPWHRTCYNYRVISPLNLRCRATFNSRTGQPVWHKSAPKQLLTSLTQSYSARKTIFRLTIDCVGKQGWGSPENRLVPFLFGTFCFPIHAVTYYDNNFYITFTITLNVLHQYTFNIIKLRIIQSYERMSDILIACFCIRRRSSLEHFLSLHIVTDRDRLTIYWFSKIHTTVMPISINICKHTYLCKHTIYVNILFM